MSDLVIRDLVVEYTSGDYKVRPVDGLNLEAVSGELVLLLGPSGCGKTTLLSCLAGILTPTSGSIRFGDIEVGTMDDAALTRYRRQTVGIIFQAFNLIPSLTATENVMAPLRSAGHGARQARERADLLLTQVQLGDRMRHRPGDLSGGQQQRVAIARALAHDPPLLLADEPTAHLDYIQVDGVLRILRSIARPGRLVVVSTHDERLLPLADRVIDLTAQAPAHARGPAHLRLEPGEVIFTQGAAGDLIYTVTSGEVELVRERSDGAEELLAVAAAGDYFGELAPLLGLRRAATARARGVAEVTGYTVAEFRKRSGDQGVAQLLGQAGG